MVEVNQFMYRVAQSVAETFVPRSQAAEVAAVIVEMALMDWEAVRAHYPAHYDELDIIRAFAQAVLRNPQTCELVLRAAERELVAA